MPSFHLLFFVTLLAAVVLAAPTEKRNLQKRSFIIPRNANPTRRQVSGYEAMRKAYMKYNIQGGFINAEKKDKTRHNNNQAQTAAAVSGNGTATSGSVTATPENNAAEFLEGVSVGGQMLNLDFDTGSSDLWVFSTQLSQQTIGQHTAFNAQKSSTFKLMNNAQFSISYGDGSGAEGIVGTDVVNIGGVSVNNQAVELATAVSQSFVQDVDTDGLLGLAFSKLNTVTTGNQKTPQNTFFANVMNNLAQPLFTADLKTDGTGSYEFGNIDTTKFTGSMVWTAVNTSSGFWQFTSDSFAVNGKTQQNTNASPAIADTGTSLLLVDDNVVTAYYSQVQGAQNDQTVGGFTYPCDAKLPDMGLAVGNNMITVPGNVVTFAAVDNTNTTCFGGIQSNSGAGIQIFGDIMFRAQLVAFNGGNSSLGFGAKQ